MASYDKFNYLIRPAKQVERKLLIEGLHKLSACGFPIRQYRYIGLGSPFYADFVLFHKFLYIDDMTCVERTDIRRRMNFNKPFPKVRLHMDEVSRLVPRLDRKRRHLIWLDYDYPLDEDMLRDLAGFATALQSESILIVTVEADPRLYDSDLPTGLADQVREHRRNTLDEQIGRFVDGGVKPSHLTRESLPALFATVIQNRLHDTLAVRGLQFNQLFNFVYADGRQMLSLGGMIGTAKTVATMRKAGVYDLPFVTTKAKPVTIWVPPLTARERLWLDQNAKTPAGQFEISPEVVKYYRQYYRYYPNYFEALL